MPKREKCTEKNDQKTIFLNSSKKFKKVKNNVGI